MSRATITTRLEALAAEIVNDVPGAEVDFTPFPSGSAMLDVRHRGHLYVLEFSPQRRFGVDEVREGEGFQLGYRFTYADFEPAAQRLHLLLNGGKDA